jgi:RNA polymerase sigma factor (TIGR02999 family)
MDATSPHEVTHLLLRWKQGERSALDALMPMVESELRRLAGSYMRKERVGHTLVPTALVNEAWLRIAQQNPDVECRSHFVAVAAHYMRQILVEHARRRNAQKRGSGDKPVDLDAIALAAEERPASLIALDDGLDELARIDERAARIVELHYFGGLSYEEIAAFLEISRSTVVRDLRLAQVWLKDYVGK